MKRDVYDRVVSHNAAASRQEVAVETVKVTHSPATITGPPGGGILGAVLGSAGARRMMIASSYLAVHQTRPGDLIIGGCDGMQLRMQPLKRAGGGRAVKR